MSETPTWAYWLPPMISGVTAFIGVVVAQKMTMNRERRHRTLQFRADTIVELQDALATVRLEYGHWTVKLRSGKLLPPTDLLAGLSRVKVLQTRVVDDMVRNSVARYSDRIFEKVHELLILARDCRLEGSVPLPENQEAEFEIHELLTSALEALGESLRKLP